MSNSNFSYQDFCLMMKKYEKSKKKEESEPKVNKLAYKRVFPRSKNK